MDGIEGIPEVDETALPEPELDVGFVELEQVDYSAPFEQTQHPTWPAPLQSGRARMFYRLVPADTDAKRKPVFVFFNGGPGFTSMLLMSYGTGPLTLTADEPDSPAAPNPNSFTRLGNLLYIDARNAGFSYLVSDDADDVTERERGLAPGSFNPAIDAADFVRVVLRVLARHPALRNNPVVLVGESYGGTRAALMLDYLLYPDRLVVEPDAYGDSTLSEEIHVHYDSVFPGVPASRRSPALHAKQFGWQVLIEPSVAGSLQGFAQNAMTAASNERMAMAAGLSVEELTSTRCLDNRARPHEWCTTLESLLPSTLSSPAGFSLLMGVDATSVKLLRASERMGAFRAQAAITAPPEPIDWLSLLGETSSFDRYYSNFAPEKVPGVFGTTDHPFYGLPFLRAARFVNTMITNARWDGNVLSEAIVPALNEIVPLEAEPPFFRGARYAGDAPDVPSEHIILDYGALEGRWVAGEREVYFPTFEHSGHAVTASEPARFFETTATFLAQTGL